jgi:L-lactate dehydrogenase complex protein LldG
MLARIGRALGHAASAPVPLPAFDAACDGAREDADDLVERFRLEAARAGARVESVGTLEGVRQYLEALLPREPGAAVAVSDARALRDAGLREWLEERGLEVVSPAPESGALSADDRGARAAAPGASETPPPPHLRALLRASLGVTSADYAVAETGTLVLLAGGERHRLVSLLPPVYVCLLDPRRIVAVLSGFLRLMRDGPYTRETVPPLATLITGPSCTADIEQTLTKGMHGPRELHVLLYAPHDGADGAWRDGAGAAA